MAKKYLLSFLCLMLTLMVGGVSATWVYADKFPETMDAVMNIFFTVFAYTPEEVLPGGEDNDKPVQPGQNHNWLIDRILNEPTKNYGLNPGGKEIISILNSKGFLYCNQKSSGSNFKFLLDSEEADELYYTIEKVTDTEYYAYTFAVQDLINAEDTNNEIEVYRTTLVKSGNKWSATLSYLGYAKTKKASQLGFSYAPNWPSNYSIDMTTWHT